MITRTREGFDVTCDGRGCTEFLEVDSPDHEFRDVLSMMRDEGWTSRKDRGDEWEHLCPACK